LIQFPGGLLDPSQPAQDDLDAVLPDPPIFLSQSSKRFARMAERMSAAAVGVAATLLLISGAQAQGSPELPAPRIPDLSQVFVLFFVMLGPVKIIAPFAAMTRDVEDQACRKLAIRAFVIASVTTLLAAAIGRGILENWHVSLGALLIAGGVILFLVALRQVLQQYAPSTEPEARQPEPALAALAMRLAFPTIVTPYGIAAVIILLSISPNAGYTIGVAAALVGVMVLNLLAMLYAKAILKAIGIMPLQIVGTVLSVMQVALGVQMILGGLRMIGVLD
jgi:multiple antibiotic resistance protein